MRVDLAFPTFPPALDGIGDYTARLAQELSNAHDVRALTAQSNPVAVESYRVEQAFSNHSRAGVLEIPSLVAEDPPEWLILQYNAFSYGRWGFNPWVPSLPEHIRQASPSTRVAVMVHEPFVPAEGWRFMIMTTWQRWQLWRLGQSADVLFFSTEPWSEHFRSWFQHTPVHHLPVGSNIPRVAGNPEDSRHNLGFERDDYIIGLFGSGHFSRLLHFVRAAVQRIRLEIPSARILYIGPAGEKVCRELSDLPVTDTGPLPAEEVSRCFQAMDLYLAPFHKGVSSRRGSFLVGLQHGLPIISTHGIHTGSELHSENGKSFVLAPDDNPRQYALTALAVAENPARAQDLATRGRKLYDSTYDWPNIASILCSRLNSDAGKNLSIPIKPA